MIMKLLLICLFLAVKISFTITSSMHMHICSYAMHFREKQRFLTWTAFNIAFNQDLSETYFLNVFDFDKSENSKWRSTRYGWTASLDEYHGKYPTYSSKINRKGNFLKYLACLCLLQPTTFLNFQKIVCLGIFELWPLCENFRLRFSEKYRGFSSETLVFPQTNTHSTCVKIVLFISASFYQCFEKKWISSSRQGENVYFIVVINR